MIATPCPFCGSNQVHIEQLLDMVTVSCLNCLAVGPVTAEQSQAEAWARWNRRASPADGSGLALVDPPADPADPADPDASPDTPAIGELPQPTACFTLPQQSRFYPPTRTPKGPR